MKAFTILAAVVCMAISSATLAQTQWVQTPMPAAGTGVRSLAVSGNHIFAGTNNGVYYSPDDGATWTARNGAFLSGRTILSIVSAGNDVFAGTEEMGTAGLLFGSTDQGLTWTNITPVICSTGQVTSMVIYNGYIYAGVFGGPSNLPSIYRSPLAGISPYTWTDFSTGLPILPGIKSMAIMGSSIIAGTYGQGVWISPASTDTWTPLGGGMGASSDYISALAVNSQHVFAGNISGLPVLYRSHDYGLTWTQSSTSIFENKPVQSLLVHNNRIYAGLDNIGVFVSDDNGVTWSTYREGLTNPNNPWGWHCNSMDVQDMVVKGSTVFLGAYGCGVWKRTIAASQYNTISGSAFYDLNSNGIREITEPFYKPVTVQIIKGTDTSSVINPFGYFNNYVDTGTYQTRVIPYSPYHTVTPVSETSSFSTYHNIDTVVFAVQPIPGKRDMGIHLFAIGPARPGFPVAYKLMYGNKGTDTADVNIQLVKGNKLNYNSASVATVYVAADTLRWNITALKPGQWGEITINFTVQPPPAANFNDTLVSVATISSNATDLAPIDNTSELRQRVTGSYDPNDKKENHDGRMLLSSVMEGEKLHYTIRFQNTGTDTAFNITVKDTLDSKLNWQSLRMIGASHDYQLTINDRICTWSFNNIQLVDSTHNEPLSHGFISFEIQARTSVVAGDVIRNSASIYFDYNLPVLTNTESTAIVTQLFPVKLVAFTVTKQDHINLLEWKVAQQANFSHFEIERSVNGKDFSRIATIVGGPVTFSYADNHFPRMVNYYRLKMVDKDGKYEYSAIIRVNNSGSMDVSLYPNPVRNVLHLQLETARAGTIELQVIVPDGRTVLQKKVNTTGGVHLIPVSTGHLSKGIYLLRITSADEVKVLRFQKD